MIFYNGINIWAELSSFFVTIHAFDRQTDRQTNGRTDKQSDRRTSSFLVTRPRCMQRYCMQRGNYRAINAHWVIHLRNRNWAIGYGSAVVCAAIEFSV